MGENLEAFQRVVERYLAGELLLAEAATAIVDLGFGGGFAIGTEDPGALESAEMQPLHDLLDAVADAQQHRSRA